MSEDATKGNADQIAGPWLGGVLPALLDFERLPGRYRLAFREPSVLFEQPLVVMQLAAGRTVPGIPLPADSPQAQAAKRAARYFVRMAMLRAGTDHYTLLGLKTDFEPTALRDHYRLMIRLTHPDFSAPGEEWPADAASRINMANDVLGSYVKRSGYDAQLAAENIASGAVPGKPKNAPPPGSNTTRFAKTQDLVKSRAARSEYQAPSAGWSTQTKIAWMACGAVACLAALLVLTPTGQGGSLVAKSERPATTLPDSSQSSDLLKTDESTAISRESALIASTKLTEDSARSGQSHQPKTKPPAIPDGAPTEASLALRIRVPPKPFHASGDANHREVLRAKDQSVDSASQATTSLQSHTGVTPTAVNGPSSSPAFKAATELAVSVAAETTSESAAPSSKVVALAPTPAAIQSSVPAQAPEPSPNPLSMSEVQPKLAQIMGALDRGRGDLVMDAVDPAWNTRDARIAFLRDYYQFLQGQKISQLNNTSFRSHSRDTSLVVNGVFSIKMVDSFENTVSRDLHIKATFVRQKGRAILTTVEARASKS